MNMMNSLATLGRIARRKNIFFSHCQALRLSMSFLIDRLLYDGRVWHMALKYLWLMLILQYWLSMLFWMKSYTWSLYEASREAPCPRICFCKCVTTQTWVESVLSCVNVAPAYSSWASADGNSRRRANWKWHAALGHPLASPSDVMCEKNQRQKNLIKKVKKNTQRKLKNNLKNKMKRKQFRHYWQSTGGEVWKGLILSSSSVALRCTFVNTTKLPIRSGPVAVQFNGPMCNLALPLQHLQVPCCVVR